MKTQIQILKAMKEVLAYCKEIDRNGSWENVIDSIISEESTLQIELEILHDTLESWLEAEKEIDVELTSLEHLNTIKEIIEEINNPKMSEVLKDLYKSTEDLLMYWNYDCNYDLLNHAYPFKEDFNEISLALRNWAIEVKFEEQKQSK
jgi:hypothetical protein